MVVTYHINEYCWGTGIAVFSTDENEVVCMAFLDLVKDKQHSFISGVSTIEKFRNRGYASNMLLELERISRHNGRYIVELETEADDEYAQKFYEKRGYVKIPELTYSTEYGTYFTYRKVMDKVEGEI